jgi:hypothetical protein
MTERFGKFKRKHGKGPDRETRASRQIFRLRRISL